MVWQDRAGTVVVSLFILHAAWKIIRPSMEQLIDRGAPEDVRMEIVRLASSIQEVKEVHAIRSRHIGYGLQVDLHVLVDPDLTVMEGHRIFRRGEAAAHRLHLRRGGRGGTSGALRWREMMR